MPYERETIEDLRDFLLREGYTRCDIPACNCGSWHGRYGLHERWREVKDLLTEADVLNNETGNLVSKAIEFLIRQRDEARNAVTQERVL